ncbi:MAG: NAD(P)H-dependent oxidoreductase [Pseudomonadota bacterium]
MSVKLLFFAGSARKDSVTKKLAKAASEMAASEGAEVTYIDLADFDMPIFNEDLEAEHGAPENAKKLKKLFMDHHGFVIANPEYNSMLTPLLKNALDWVSRKHEDEAGLAGYKGKTCALFGASPGALGGLRCLTSLRPMLSSIGVHVIPNQLAVGHAYDKFDENGNVTDEAEKERIQGVVKDLVHITKALNA